MGSNLFCHRVDAQRGWTDAPVAGGVNDSPILTACRLYYIGGPLFKFDLSYSIAKRRNLCGPDRDDSAVTPFGSI